MTTLRKLDDFIDELYEIKYKNRKWEGITEFFIAYKGEDIDDFRPNYNYEETQKEIKEINRYRIYLISLVNKTKAQYFVEEEGMTIDELEMYKNDLRQRINHLNTILEIKPATEECSNGIVMETCCNYDEESIRKEIEEIKRDLDRVQNTLGSVYDSAIVPLNESERQWEEIIEERNKHIDNKIDKKLWDQYDAIRQDLYYSIDFNRYAYKEEEFMRIINPNWWEYLIWWR